MLRRSVWLGAAVVVLGTGTAWGAAILPQGYGFSPGTNTGDYVYSDTTTPSRLTDGVRGGDDWTAPYADGIDGNEPWLGWYGILWDGSGYAASDYSPVDVAIDFDFLAGDTVGSVVVGTNQDAVTNWNVVLPSSVQLWHGGTLLDEILTPFSTANSGVGTTSNVGKRHELVLSFDPVTFTADDKLSLVLSNADNFALANSANPPIPWNNDPNSTDNGMFWIFVDKVSFSTTPVPEAGTLALLATGLPLLAAVRRRRP